MFWVRMRYFVYIYLTDSSSPACHVAAISPDLETSSRMTLLLHMQLRMYVGLTSDLSPACCLVVLKFMP